MHTLHANGERGVLPGPRNSADSWPPQRASHCMLEVFYFNCSGRFHSHLLIPKKLVKCDLIATLSAAAAICRAVTRHRESLQLFKNTTSECRMAKISNQKNSAMARNPYELAELMLRQAADRSRNKAQPRSNQAEMIEQRKWPGARPWRWLHFPLCRSLPCSAPGHTRARVGLLIARLFNRTSREQPA